MCHWAGNKEQSGKRARQVGLVLLLFWVWLNGSPAAAATPVLASLPHPAVGENNRILSTIWPPIIQQWSEEIQVVSDLYGIHPDLIAAVINAESNGLPDVVSRVGAVGLMGVLPSGPGMEWRPSPEALKDPAVNLNWGGAILSDIIQQAGGDIAAALAAYSGGWEQADRRVPLEYAARVLDQYGRAIVARAGIPPETASRWTVAVRINRGNIANELLVLGEQPVSGVLTFEEHVVYQGVGTSGQSFYVVGYAVPLVLLIPQDQAHPAYNGSYSVDPHLIARIGLSDMKANQQNVHVVLACLPGLDRLRGQLSTRWYAPSSCPSWQR